MPDAVALFQQAHAPGGRPSVVRGNLTAAADAGYAPAQYEMGMDLIGSTNLDESTRALAYLEQASLQGYPEATRQLAALNEHGGLITPDANHATDLYARAATDEQRIARTGVTNANDYYANQWRTNPVDAQASYRQALREIPGTPAAINAYRTAAQRGHVPSQLALGKILMANPQNRDEWREGYSYLRLAAHAQQPEATQILAQIHTAGSPELPPNAAYGAQIQSRVAGQETAVPRGSAARDDHFDNIYSTRTAPIVAGGPIPAGTGGPIPAGTGGPIPAGAGGPTPAGAGGPTPAGAGGPIPAGAGGPIPAGVGAGSTWQDRLGSRLSSLLPPWNFTRAAKTRHAAGVSLHVMAENAASPQQITEVATAHKAVWGEMPGGFSWGKTAIGGGVAVAVLTSLYGGYRLLDGSSSPSSDPKTKFSANAKTSMKPDGTGNFPFKENSLDFKICNSTQNTGEWNLTATDDRGRTVVVLTSTNLSKLIDVVAYEHTRAMDANRSDPSKPHGKLSYIATQPENDPRRMEYQTELGKKVSMANPGTTQFTQADPRDRSPRSGRLHPDPTTGNADPTRVTSALKPGSTINHGMT